MDFVIFLAVLSALIVAHEFGHFLAARRSGVKVEEFSIGFGPTLLKIAGKQTNFFIKAILFGGYVKLAGDSREQAKGSPDELLVQPAGIKIRIVTAGPLFNFLMAYVLFWIVAVNGMPSFATTVGEVMPGYPAQTAGVLKGDKILEVNGKPVSNWRKMSSTISASREEVRLKIQRGSQYLEKTVSLKTKDTADQMGKRRRIIGITPSGDITIERCGFFKAFWESGRLVIEQTQDILRALYLMITGAVSAKEAVTGPLGMYYLTSEIIKLGLIAFLHYLAVLSVMLGTINLLPLPALDGGYVFMFLWEKIRGRQISDKAADMFNRVGLAFLITLFVLVSYNDVLRYGPRIYEGIKHFGTKSG